MLDARLVTLRCRAGGDGRVGALELHGDLPHWHQGVALAPAGAGRWEATLRLPPGAYEYKLLAPGGTWLLDEDNPRTRSVAGRRNNLLVVGGADEPLLHVPAAPFVEATASGGVRVRAGLRRGAGAALALRWGEGAAMQTTGMRLAGDEDEHLLFEAELPGAGRFLEYVFLLQDGRVVGHAGHALRVERRALPAPPPAWWQDAVVYTVFVDRFRRGGGALLAPERWDREHRAGGDLAGVIEALPYLADLGVTALHLTPIVVAASPHRYDAVDHRRVDPALGGEDALARLVEAAGARGVRVLLDVTVTHLHRDAAPFRDAAARGPESPYWPWFKARRWPFGDGPDPGYEHYQKGQWQEPLLQLDDPGVEAWLVSVFEHWARRGVAGFRVDAAADVPVALCARLREAVQGVTPDAVLFGEVVPAGLERWTAAGALDAATDFAAHARLTGWLAGRLAAGEVAADAAMWRFRRGGEGARRLAFTATHDQARLKSVVGDARAARLGQALVLLGGAVPLLTYGDEVGLAADDAGDACARDFEDAWPERRCMPWDPAAWDHETLAAVRGAAALRRAHEVLRRGDETVVDAGPDALVVRRRLGATIVDVVAARAPVRVALPPAGPDAGARVLWTLGEARLESGDDGGDGDGDGALVLGAFALAVVDRTPRPAPVELSLRAGNAALVARAFADGLTEVPAYPTRLYLTVTEACNLRCVHCITDAPRLTREGRDRQARPWLLDALAEPFAHADYLAFTHGGESLTSPLLFTALERFAAARAGRPGRADVHLATNGMLLDEARARRLVELGVTSVMVSIDGATPAVNDRIRVGGALERVLANVRGVLALRARLGADLRLGLSTVVGRANLAEVDALCELACRLGVDWLKLEETYPATPFARLDLLPPRDPALAEAVERAGERLAAAGVVLVDHLDPPAGCACGGDARAAAFRVADDFANRARFRPCRMAWEQAAIDPDGTVHVVDYAGPALGRAGERDFLALWNGPAAQELRVRALAAAPVERRRACVTGSSKPWQSLANL
jgi:glycosidase/MoaA/NifB/PqqE/SkfB family radical SAM enzyme